MLVACNDATSATTSDTSSGSSSSSTTEPLADSSSSGVDDTSSSSSSSTGTPPDVGVDIPEPRAIAITAGGTSTCALFDDGQLRCWGGGDIGTPEDGEPAHTFPPIQAGAAVVDATDGAARCAVLETGVARCWNTPNTDGTAGYGYPAIFGDDEDAVYAPPLELGIDATRIVAGLHHVCAHDDAGALLCWGTNDAAQLGYGGTQTVGDDEVPEDLGPVPVGGEVTDIALGAQFTCALRAGTVVCWGADYHGLLGQGEYPVFDRAHPYELPSIALGGPVRTIDAGDTHACAVLENGDLRCWGSAHDGVLGHGGGVGLELDVGDDELPSSVPAVDVGGPVRDVACGWENTCALLEDGAVRCWGVGAVVGLGMGAFTLGDFETPASVGPIELPMPAVAITLSKFALGHACAILQDGTIRCWGYARGGALGYEGSENIGDDETPIDLPPVPVFAP